MKKNLQFLALLCALFPLKNIAGFYTGLSGGVDTSIFKQDAHISQLSNFNTIDKERHAGKGYLGGLLAGYSLYYQMYILSGELNANVSTLEFNSENLEFVHANFAFTSYRINHNYSINVLPGIMLDESCQLYLLGGLALGNFKTTTNDRSLRSVHKKLRGLRYGIGLEKHIWDKVGLRFEYSNFTYNKVHMFTFDVTSNTRKKTHIRTETNQFVASIIYRFC